MSSFKYAGVSTLNGKIKARFANDQMRVKVLAKNGHKDIDIIELKHPMTKQEAVAFLLSINFDNGNAAVRAAIEAEVEKRTDAPKAAKAPKAKAEKAPKAPKMPKLPKYGLPGSGSGGMGRFGGGGGSGGTGPGRRAR